MPDWVWILLYVSASLPVLVWLGILLHPARPWDFQPVAENLEPPTAPETWPSVVILVPARNEAESLPQTLPGLLSQNYPGPWRMVLVNDRSTDGTGALAQKIAAAHNVSERLSVLNGAALPEGWTGKVWAQEQARLHATAASQAAPDYFLLTDADILHAPGSLTRLVRESVGWKLALNSRMARLRCVALPEQLLIPAFVWFFNLLYPMRRVNNPADPLPGAAGGCVLLERSALERAGGFSCIKNEIIDDVNLSRHIKALGVPIRLSLSNGEVASLREYNELGEVWKMVRRTAFTELKYSYFRLGVALFGLALIFIWPVLLCAGGTVCGLVGALGVLNLPALPCLLLAAKGFFCLALSAVLYRPAIRFFGLRSIWAWTLPVAGVLYGMMTFDSGWRYARGLGVQWRDKKCSAPEQIPN